MDELSIKLTEIFADSEVKTIGDLVDARQLEDLELLPQAVRDHAIGLDADVLSVFSKGAYEDMRNAGIASEAIEALVGEVVEFKVEMIEKAHAALTLN